MFGRSFRFDAGSRRLHLLPFRNVMAHDDPRPPSEHVRLEADLVARSLSDTIWVSDRSSRSRPGVLIVEANPELRSHAAEKLRTGTLANGLAAFRVMTAVDGTEAASMLDADGIDFVICGHPGSPSDALKLHEALNGDSRFKSGAVLHVASEQGSAATAALREPGDALLVSELLADLIDGWSRRAPPDQ